METKATANEGTEKLNAQIVQLQNLSEMLLAKHNINSEFKIRNVPIDVIETISKEQDIKLTSSSLLQVKTLYLEFEWGQIILYSETLPLNKL